MNRHNLVFEMFIKKNLKETHQKQHESEYKHNSERVDEKCLWNLIR